MNTSLDIALTALVMAARQFIVAEIDYAAAVETGRGNGRIAHARDYRDKAEQVLTDAIAAFADAVIAEASKA